MKRDYISILQPQGKQKPDDGERKEKWGARRHKWTVLLQRKTSEEGFLSLWCKRITSQSPATPACDYPRSLSWALCPEAARTNPTHRARFSQGPRCLEELPLSFRELNRDKLPCAGSHLSPTPICCFPDDGTGWAHNQNKTEGRLSWLSSVAPVPDSRDL